MPSLGVLIAPEADLIDRGWLALQYCFGGQLGTDEYTLNQDIAEVRSYSYALPLRSFFKKTVVHLSYLSVHLSVHLTPI